MARFRWKSNLAIGRNQQQTRGARAPVRRPHRARVRSDLFKNPEKREMFDRLRRMRRSKLTRCC
jgi:hypothetical protein